MYAAHPEYWPLGLLAGLWVAAEWMVYRRSKRYIPRLFDPKQISGWRPGAKFAFRAAAAAMFFVAAIGPCIRGWSLSTGKPQRDLYLVMDVSRGMLTEDVPGGRWGLAQTLADSLISRAEVDRVGIIAFASMPYVQCPMSADKPLAQKYLRLLHP
ncbi:MAG: VWA domain-containing protein, partial [Bacteroidia bacterium]|nr:VWA domain-containing protein [Bacteroidia bacterium]MDW8333215.1 VWA domain-containing protein [Bacteroidia bacterium]